MNEKHKMQRTQIIGMLEREKREIRKEIIYRIIKDNCPELRTQVSRLNGPIILDL